MKNTLECSTSAICTELKTEYRALMESRLAELVITNQSLVSSVNILSKTIVNLLKQHQTSILEIIKNNKNMIAYIYDPKFYGHLNRDIDGTVTPIQIFDDFIQTLENRDTPLQQVMLLHAQFIHDIYGELSKNYLAERFHKAHKDAAKVIFPMSLFSERCRIPNNIEPEVTQRIGSNRNPVFQKRVGLTTPHTKSMHRFFPNTESRFYQMQQSKNLPFVCDISGHTGSLLLGAQLYAQFSLEEKKQYAMATFAYLEAGGNHSFDEVMIIIAPHWFKDYIEGDYQSILPKSILESEKFDDLRDEIDYFSETTSSYNWRA